MAERGLPSVEAEVLNQSARAFIDAQRSMTLATADGHAAWAAPVYYVFFKSGFYFFSGSDSRHVREALKTGRAAAAISADTSDWRQIRGIQMSGGVREVPSGMEAAGAVRAYLKRFAFTRTFFAAGERPDLQMLSRRFRVRLYRFEPEIVYYLDNSLGFGFRQKVSP